MNKSTLTLVGILALVVVAVAVFFVASMNIKARQISLKESSGRAGHVQQQASA